MISALYYQEPFEENYIPNVLKEIYMDRLYYPYLMGKKDLTIIDAGANIGLTTRYFSQFAKQIIAIEPAAQAIEIFKKNTEDLKNVTLVPVALSNQPGEKILYHTHKNKTMNTLTAELEDKEDIKEKVKVTTLEQIILDYKIEHVDFLKLDVEGEEANVLGSDSFARVADKIDTIILEYHAWTKRNIDQLKTTMKDLGFSFAPIPCDTPIFVCEKIR